MFLVLQPWSRATTEMTVTVLRDRGVMVAMMVVEMSSEIHCRPHKRLDHHWQQTVGPVLQIIRWIVCLYPAEVATDQREAEEDIYLVAVMVLEEATVDQGVPLHQEASGEEDTLVKDVEDMVLVVEAASVWVA